MIQVSNDDGRTWITLDQCAAAVAFAGRKTAARFIAWLRAGYVVEVNGVDYRIAPKQELDTQ